MNRRGQVFLVAAIIIVGILIGLIASRNSNRVVGGTSFRAVDSFADNFDEEIYRIVDLRCVQQIQATGQAGSCREDGIISAVDTFQQYADQSFDDLRIDVQNSNIKYPHNAVLISNPEPWRIYWRITSIKNGETYVKQNF